MPPVVGMRFGRYELLDKLGAGGMGEVYRAGGCACAPASAFLRPGRWASV